MIRCRTLGPVLVTIGDHPAPPELLWRKHLALLVYLARSPRRTRSREQLIGLLWADKAESAARHSLNEALRVVRRTAGNEAIDALGDNVTLGTQQLWIDVDEFEQLESHSDLAGASSLVIGEFLEGFAVPGASGFEDWLSAERGYWSERTVGVLTRQARALAGRGDLAEAVRLADRALRINPLSEGASDVLIRSLALQGERIQALERFERYAELLRLRLELTPSQSLQSLADRVRLQPDRPPRPGPAIQELERRRRLPLAARERELELLLEQWTSALTARSPRMALIMGEPGTGKTRLLEELSARVRLDRSTVLPVRAIPADRDAAESAILALASGSLCQVRGVGAASPAAIAVLAARLPEWAERFPNRDRRPDADVSLRHALLEILRAVAEEQPLLLWVDEAQFLDTESLEVLEAVLRDGAGIPLLLVLAAAPHPARPELDRIRSRIGRELTGVTIPLSPLPTEALRALAAAALPSYPSHDLERVTRRLAIDSAGLPLLAVELLHAIAGGLELDPADGIWPEPLRTLTDTLPGDLPDSISAAIRVGFRCLSGPAQRVLATASALGDRVVAEELSRATELPLPQVTDALDELEWTRWLVSEPRGYSFVARIMRDVVARDMLTPGQLRRLQQLRSATAN